MTLVLKIEHLLGVSFAARGQESDLPDWPPQPDRVFSALVAAWGARGESEAERRALEWLEAQPAPDIIESGGVARTAPTVFVPPNDPESHRVADIAVMPARRRRQARRFPAFRPADPTVSLIWRAATPAPAILDTLNAIAADTAYVGHSASLTRCRFHTGDHRDPGQAGAPPRRAVYPGRLAELEERYRRMQQVDPANARAHRPRPGHPVRTAFAEAASIRSGIFSDDWLVLEHVDDRDGGGMPDIRAAALVAREIRNCLMSGYRRIGRANAIPAAISGHAPDGTPSGEPHLAIVPLAFLGTPYASGAVFGFALVPPRTHDLVADPGFRRAFGAVLRRNEDEGRRELILDRLSLTFAVGEVSGRRSLDPMPYVASARVWASCTPIVLDRHLKATGNQQREDEIIGLIRQACANIDLPPPLRVIPGKHAAIEGSPSAYPSGRAPPWTRWRLPESLASRQLTHAVIEFCEEVKGPVILGAGRFVGLGLCRPLHAARGSGD
jgi:CRISPR-associated protein Csb2